MNINQQAKRTASLLYVIMQRIMVATVKGNPLTRGELFAALAALECPKPVFERIITELSGSAQPMVAEIGDRLVWIG